MCTVLINCIIKLVICSMLDEIFCLACSTVEPFLWLEALQRPLNCLDISSLAAESCFTLLLLLRVLNLPPYYGRTLGCVSNLSSIKCPAKPALSQMYL